MFSFFKKKPKPVDPTPVVVPRIKHKNFLVAIDSIPGMTDESRPVTEALVGDLYLSYAIDIGPSYISVTPANLRDHNLAQADLRRLAETNGLAAMRKIHVGTDGTIHELAAPENMAACTILYPALWQQIEKEMGCPVAVAFPHRDIVLYAPADSKGITALTEVIGQMNFEDTHALSRLLYRPSPAGWSVVAA
ncbi:hypothetical protein GCM10007421_12090 [Halopseudomonas oceani]|uniref:Uncharacterized protein n=1 Tax=Halopseudomonas oceani TaxID=1708783 RepID=A0A2P4EWW2_9GAMM|nr:DUF1444 family protein [Halopseudomonas oceani]POB04503.1 hypothetical protein C1949_05890 [Halopseudomonas oceani]GGE39735.1 hypothetical protein GCM10007421_12090 [Halopseudomonas oceani]